MTDESQRERMVERLSNRDCLGKAVEAALRAVPRHEFVPESRRGVAYQDTPLPIGEGQTISAPHMVALMAELLDFSPGHRVLEIGTGCGYHAAVTAELVGPENVYSVEYHEQLTEQARENLDRTGYNGVSVRAGDGREGWPEFAPYDRAYLTCAASDFPPAVVEQVRPGGILLAPLGNGRQVLVRARAGEAGITDREQHGHVRFVPLK